MATTPVSRERRGRAAPNAPLFRNLGWRAVVATLLPFVLATVVGNSLTFVLLPGADGFFVTVTLLWAALWVAAFFHAMFDSSLPRVLWLQGGVILAAAAVLVPAFLTGAST
jgi:hypothetical protein